MSKTLLDAPIYIDTYKLAGRLYDLRFALPKRDRAVLGERMLDAVMGMLSDFTMSYKLRGSDKLVYTDRFLAHFEVLKGLMRICCDKKLYGGDKACKGLFGVSQEDVAKLTRNEKKFISTFEYIKRIDDGIIAWREKLSREVRSTKASNDGLRSGIQKQLRGGDGIINTIPGSAP
jgi:hypothetical protein